MTTHFADGVSVGLAGTPVAPLAQRSNLDAQSIQGFPVARIASYTIVPLTLSATNFRAAAAVSGAGALTLTAGTGLTSTTVNDNGTTRSVIAMDVPRNLRITSAGNDSGITFAVSGFDVYGQPMNETITGANAGIAAGKKAFFSVLSITASGASAGNVSVGTGDVFGLPYRVADAGFLTRAGWAGALAEDAGTFAAADANTATATTGDIRGTYLPSSASNGTRRLVLAFVVQDADTAAGLYGVTQF
jgi:hypothetical protein